MLKLWKEEAWKRKTSGKKGGTAQENRNLINSLSPESRFLIVSKKRHIFTPVLETTSTAAKYSKERRSDQIIYMLF